MQTPSEDAAGPAAPAPPLDDARWRMAEHWPELVQAVTSQAIESVELLMRGLDLLVQRGKLSAAEFQVLATPAQRLKQCGIQAQQIVRFQSGHVRQSHEKIDLALLIESVLQERRDALAHLGITVQRLCTPIELQIDPTLGYSLTQAMLDWGAKLGRHMDMQLDLTEEDPPRARLCLRIHASASPVPTQVFLDNIHWLLLRQIAATDGAIELQRKLHADGVDLTAWFKRVLASRLPNRLPLQSDDAMVSTVVKTVSGAYVLVCSAAPEVRIKTLGIIGQLGVQANAVANAAQATAGMRSRDVHLLILDEEHPPADIAQLRFDLAALHPDLAVLRLVLPRAQPQDVQVGDSAVMAQKMQVPLNALDSALGPAVMFTLSNVL